MKETATPLMEDPTSLAYLRDNEVYLTDLVILF